ncbi:hypothetical protein P153DRAFT_106817 [Dothidotthia symphoricarpi CBS 119687]|uniref:RRM domain-containing protein n=1 Tax=Dothidotthia symphoricarpi CBS 119687 TaxID=1392245 RepID=A0A6A6AQI9_9PLEO|nr:uncharacterized protein P153DRAFT_106817 [Dothidotthia symphoricarpi CBS 119687]KAF2134199.1 hypothetical protein P153DRAFT_106817 [Dothidotthia symphoricarpi CBS 119687]
MYSRARVRTSSSANQSLLGMQLATISDTLAKASQRRDADMQHKVSKGLSVAPTPDLTVGSASEASGTSDLGHGDSDVELEELQKRIGEVATRFPLSTMYSTATEMGFDTASVSLRGGEGNYEDGQGHLLAERRRMIQALDDDDFDPGKMLAELDGRTQFLRQAVVADDDDDDPRSMLAALERRTQLPSQKIIHDNGDDDLRSMLAEFERESLRVQPNLEDTASDDLEALRSGIAAIDLPSHQQGIHHSICSDRQAPHSQAKRPYNHEETPDTSVLDEDATLYKIASILANTGHEWEKVQGLTTYLFSTVLDGHEAQQQKEEFMRQAREELETIIHKAVEEEKIYYEGEEKSRLPRRLVVSNIAAGAVKEDLIESFSQHRWEIQEVRLLKQRDPIKRTQMAHIDFWKRKAAVEASFKIADIFGLCVNTRLAVEKADYC